MFIARWGARALFLTAVCLSRPAVAKEATVAAAAKETTVAQWTRFEAELTAQKPLVNALQELDVNVELTSPTGKTHQVLAFWDGDQTFRFRFAPDEVGAWRWRTQASRADDPGLHDRSGSFTAVPYKGKNPLYRRGVLRLSEDRHHFVHADGTPFFWLADTAWNGPMKADARSWDRYLRNRAAKRFNVIQFVTTQWRAATGNADARPAFTGREKLVLDAAFFRWMDARVNAINDHGLVAAPVAIWAIAGDVNPGSLPDDQVIKLARYIVARYGAHHVVWFLAGDGEYRGAAAERWKKIGRAVFGDKPSRLVTMHPGGLKWVADDFRNEPWYAFNGYQSGHTAVPSALNFLLDGGLTKEAGKSPTLPHINLEPAYELHNIGGKPVLFSGKDVRRASWWSLLLAPPAGITYGVHGIWSWELERNYPMLHVRAGVAPPWHEALDVEGAVSMAHLYRFFTAMKWWTLRPAPELLVDPPAPSNPDTFTVAARSQDDGLVVVYSGGGGEVKLRTDAAPIRSAEWFDPATGARRKATSTESAGARLFKAATPDRDWVLVVRTAGQTASR